MVCGYSNHKIELWSDYEKRLGEITTIVTDDNKQKFEDDKMQLDLLLQNYLRIEESKIEMNSDESLNIIKGSFIELVQCHRPSDSNLIVNILKQYPTQDFYFNTLSLRKMLLLDHQIHLKTRFFILLKKLNMYTFKRKEIASVILRRIVDTKGFNNEMVRATPILILLKKAYYEYRYGIFAE